MVYINRIKPLLNLHLYLFLFFHLPINYRYLREQLPRGRAYRLDIGHAFSFGNVLNRPRGILTGQNHLNGKERVEP